MGGYSKILCAGLIWGTTGLFVRSLQSKGIDAVSIVILRALVATVLMLVWALSKDRRVFAIDASSIGLILAIGVSNVVLSQLSFIYTMTHTPVAVAVILNYTAPIFATLLSRLIYGEPITPAKLLALALSLGGLVFVVGLHETSGRVELLYILTGLASGFSYALHTVLFKAALKKRSPLYINLWGTAFGTLSVALFASLGPTGISFPRSASSWAVAGLMGLGPGLLAFMLYFSALASTEVSRASVVAMSEPVAAFVLGVVVLHERFTMLQVVGMLLVLLGIAITTSDSYRGVRGRPHVHQS
ncbi:MAG TPA: EamA family transporter [Firmicutes bacterium]|nr:EamA family transporter [Bacillota bacterium]